MTAAIDTETADLDLGRLLSVKELAAYLGVPVPTIHDWNSNGLAPKRMRVGRYVRYRQSDVDEWLERRAIETGEKAEPLERYISAVVAAAPRLTEEQKAKIATLLRGTEKTTDKK